MISTHTTRRNMNVHLILVVMSSMFVNILSDCIFPKHQSETEAIKKFKESKLYGLSYTAEDSESDGYSYTIGICKSVLDGAEDIGVLQRQKGDTEAGSDVVVGRTSAADFMAGTDWILLEYGDGKNYNSHCGSEKRRASIMIVCDPKEYIGFARVLEENKNKSQDCYYLFEVSHYSVCSGRSAGGLSVGSILLIILFTVAAVYLICGFIYQRFIVGAKGWEQMPNFSFWQDFGNLQADGCDFFCRSGSRMKESRQYRGIGDDQIQEIEDDRDDNLLPM